MVINLLFYNLNWYVIRSGDGSEFANVAAVGSKKGGATAARGELMNGRYGRFMCYVIYQKF